VISKINKINVRKISIIIKSQLLIKLNFNKNHFAILEIILKRDCGFILLKSKYF